MRSGAGIEVLAGDRTYAPGLEGLRHLLFFGRRRICFVLDGAAYTVSRYRLVVVAGTVPAARLVRPEAP